MNLHPHTPVFLALVFCLSRLATGQQARSPALQDPKFAVAAKDIIDSKIHHQGGRTITVQQIAPIALPPPPIPTPPQDRDDPAFQARIAHLRALRPRFDFIRLGATVYRSKDSAPRTLVNYWPNRAGKPVTLWSSADFALLSGFSTFEGSDGRTYSLMMTWSEVNIDLLRSLFARHDRSYEAPISPALPAGNATFTVISENPAAEDLVVLQFLHDFHNNNYERLKTAATAREQARLQQAAELMANPPQPKDIVLNHWFSHSVPQTPQKGSAR